MLLGTKEGLGPGDIVLATQLPSPSLKGHSPQFSANVRCGQTTAWTKMPLGVEVGLDQSTVFDGDPAPTRKNGTASHPISG